MTRDEYDRAPEIISELDNLRDEIENLKSILRNDTDHWLMDVRANRSHSYQAVDHCGMLPEFLETIYSKTIAEYEALKREL
jgi:predicted DNA-binding ribbon-helix-helix protein